MTLSEAFAAGQLVRFALEGGMLLRGAYVSLLLWSMLHNSLASLQQQPYESLSDYGLTSLRAQAYVNGSTTGISPEIGALSTLPCHLALEYAAWQLTGGQHRWPQPE